jgi:hypothetical protein
MSIVTTVTEVTGMVRDTVRDTITGPVKESVGDTEAKVVAVARDLQGTVIGYVQKGVDYVQSGTFAEHVRKGGDYATERLPEVEKLPAPAEVVDAVSGFVTSVVESATEAIAPLVGRSAKPAPAAEATTSAPAAKATKSTKSAKPTKSTKSA